MGKPIKDLLLLLAAVLQGKWILKCCLQHLTIQHYLVTVSQAQPFHQDPNVSYNLFGTVRFSQWKHESLFPSLWSSRIRKGHRLTFIYMFNLLSNCFGHRQTAIKSLTFDFKLWDLFEINWLTFKWSPDDSKSEPFKVWSCVTGGECWFTLRLGTKHRDWSISANQSSGLHTIPVNNHWVKAALYPYTHRKRSRHVLCLLCNMLQQESTWSSHFFMFIEKQNLLIRNSTIFKCIIIS